MALGLSREEFFSLTPRQYGLLLEQHKERQRHAEWLTGVLASTIANWSMASPKEALQPRDFALPLLRDDGETPVRRHRINRRRVADSIRAAFDSRIEK